MLRIRGQHAYKGARVGHTWKRIQQDHARGSGDTRIFQDHVAKWRRARQATEGQGSAGDEVGDRGGRSGREEGAQEGGTGRETGRGHKGCD